MSEDGFYRYLAAIRARPDKGERGWETWFRAELEDAFSNVLDDLGQLRENGPTKNPTGAYRFVSVAEVTRTFAGAAWLRESDCPFVGSTVGFLSWEWWGDDVDDREFFAGCVAFASRGVIARTDDGRFFETVVEEEFRLADAGSSHGFHDGDFFWEGDPKYADYVRTRIVDAVEALGLTPELFTGGTGHNPHRLNYLAPRAGQTHASCWEIFRAHEQDPIRFWGMNIAGMSTALRDLIAD